MTFTKEQLINQAREEVAFWRERDEVIPSQQTAIRLHLAEITLAALTAEPVYQACKEAGVWVDIDAQDVDSLRFNGEQIRKVYTAQPAPGLPECYKRLLHHAYGMTMGHDWNKGTMAGHHREKLCQAVEECRAAMLQGAEPVQEWIPCSERMPNPKTGVMVGCRFGREWAVKWATYLPYHPDAHKSGFLMPGGSWTPTHWMPIPAAPQPE